MPAFLTAEEKLAAVKAVELHGSIGAAAEALGVSRTTLAYQYRRGIAAGFDEAIVHPAPAGHTVKGISTLYTASGAVAAQWVKTRTDGPTLDETIEAVRGAFADWEGKAPYISPSSLGGAFLEDQATIYPLADWHVGLLAWRRETGEDWDLTIAQRTITEAMDRLILSSPPSDTAVVLGLGDLLHSDGYENTTTKSKNMLDVDGRWPKVLRAATDVLIHTIELARIRHRNVIVRILPGNHDEESAIAVTLALSLYYAGAVGVTVDDDPSRFWWWSFGNSLLGATHGDKAKMKELPLLMAARNPGPWGTSKYRHIYTGHIHTQTAIEQAGVVVESFRTPAAPDSWHHSMGYGAGRSVTSITFNKTDGEISRARAAIITKDAA